ncbi:ATP-binding cassette subfamily B protein [Caldicellulosiruptor bescii]|uniref:ABC transporter related n=2 Tax=Caldicellulosiruptor bescii TaxID=31899 RepID=B9MLK2_CALBD|nr:ABC transporter ATP-binding protein [Caldicellulosiruptor bescii]ACM59210.1 ABC transporter related [Caldicellulosiruptor bescii DSM 6725]PBC88334.1 ATP-binding cassette subfamily B protein [Caldicellulosiruptor bescii]PBC92185.1 ATP-binding cassette subfamily B protein [Caldicellulosiruptor bescii]PBD05005.1 ATP-binding cassette subfamily B protein [Caldicellulosiruptor bescii]PBD05364.1 ATP-binding cassette subfamily B protein [Caldicellulosiruptor bescii]
MADPVAKKPMFSQEETNYELKIPYLKRLFKFLLPYKKWLVLTLIFMFVATVAELVSPYLLKQAVDYYIPKKDFKGILIIGVLLILMLFINKECSKNKIRLANRTGQMVLFDIRKALFDHVQSLSFSFFEKNSTGRIIVRIVNDVNTLNNLFTNGIVNVITDMSSLVLAAIIMFSINPKLAIVTFAALPIFLVVLFTTRNAIKRNWRTVRRKIANLNAYIHENICGIRVIQAYVRQKVNRAIFKDVIDDVFLSWMKAVRINGIFSPAVEVCSMIGTLIIYFYGVKLLKINGVTVGTLIAFVSYLDRFWRPVVTLSNFYNQLLVASASSERIFEVLSIQPEIKEDKNPVEISTFRNSIEFKNVWFAYKDEEYVLKDVSFEIKKGMMVALVGATGSGKTTIANLLSRFYDPQKGSILIDGIDLKKISFKSLRKLIGIVQQEPFLFSGSILDNILYGKPDAKFEEVIEVCKFLGAHEFISQFEDGYFTQVNERGNRLSTGQKQLISLARLLLQNPQILILDEATASLDTHSELMVQNALNKVMKDRTSIVIAHRLSTIKDADLIIVMDKGRIAEMGTHESLIRKKGIYYELCASQIRFVKAG